MFASAARPSEVPPAGALPAAALPAAAAGPRPAVDDDSAGGLAMFLIFTAAVLIVTGAVVIVALVGAWWAVGFAFAVHAMMTTVVIATIVSVMKT